MVSGVWGQGLGAPRRRAGFTLVEVLVALTIFGVGALGAVATFALAARLVREAAARDAAVSSAGAVTDSVLRLDRPGTGERRAGRTLVRWSAPALRPAPVELVVEYGDTAGPRHLRFRLVHLAPLPRLEAP